VEYHITHYDLEQGALEIQYIEEFFGEFPRKKTAVEIMRRLQGRAHIILLASAPLPDDPGSVVPVSFKVAHEIKAPESVPKLVDLVHRLSDNVIFDGRRVLYTWIGGTRRDWRGQGFFRALTEQQELWAIEQGFDEVVVKTKNRFLRHARDAGPPAVRGRQVRAEPDRQCRIKGVSEQEADGRDDLRPSQRENRRPDSGLAKGSRFPFGVLGSRFSLSGFSPGRVVRVGALLQIFHQVRVGAEGAL